MIISNHILYMYCSLHLYELAGLNKIISKGGKKMFLKKYSKSEFNLLFVHQR